MEHGVNLFKKSTVQQLRDSIILRGVVGSGVSFSALRFQKNQEKKCQVTTSVLSTAARPKALDAHSSAQAMNVF
jgi:hypothetical protein